MGWKGCINLHVDIWEIGESHGYFIEPHHSTDSCSKLGRSPCSGELRFDCGGNRL